MLPPGLRDNKGRPAVDRVVSDAKRMARVGGPRIAPPANYDTPMSKEDQAVWLAVYDQVKESERR